MTDDRAGRPAVRGRVVDAQTRCVHYRTSRDVVAMRFFCCGEYYPCYRCHEECAGHPGIPWPADRRDEPAVLCGVCGARLSVTEYLGVTACPACAAEFNPACGAHADIYFAPLP